MVSEDTIEGRVGLSSGSLEKGGQKASEANQAYQALVFPCTRPRPIMTPNVGVDRNNTHSGDAAHIATVAISSDQPSSPT